LALLSSNNPNNKNQRRIGSILNLNESNNIRSPLKDDVRNYTNNNIASLNTNANNRALRSLSTNNQNNNNYQNRNNRISNQNINAYHNSLIYQNYGLFPFISDGVNFDIGNLSVKKKRNLIFYSIFYSSKNFNIIKKYKLN
jgi:hypothetical protein